MRPWWDDPRLVDTLPISPQAYQATLRTLDALQSPAPGVPEGCPPSRTRPRPHPLSARVLLRFADGGRAAYAVKAHRLNVTDVAFLHGFPVAPDTWCEIALHDLDQRVAVPSGRVVGCRDLGRRVYEINVAFTRPLDTSRFLPVSAYKAGSDSVLLAVRRFPG